MSLIDDVSDRLAKATEVVIDTETTGLDWRTCKICGYVFTFGPGPDDTFYLPVRHETGENFDPQKVRAMILHHQNRDRHWVGHNLAFDAAFLTAEGIDLKGTFEDTMLNAALLDEFQRSFSLEYCAELADVQAKKSDEILTHIMQRFDLPKTKGLMGNFWRLDAYYPMAREYAAGDGTTTWQLAKYQRKLLEDQDLMTVHKVECDLIPVLNRMTMRGIKVDTDRLHRLRFVMQAMVIKAQNEIGEDLNINSGKQLEKYFIRNGVTEFPKTATGRPSFNEEFLATTEAGRRIINVRKASHMLEAFIDPMIERHLFKGRVHSTYNQLRGDVHGTVTGRLSSSNPNLQQVPKRNKTLGILFRSIFLPDKGMVWGSADFSQCLVAGTRISVPGGYKNIEDMRPGDLVYSYDDNLELVIRRVTWAGQTGTRSVCRVKWMTNGRTKGHLDMTSDHPIRMIDGTYKTPFELCNESSQGKKGGHPYHVRVMALRRGQMEVKGETRNYLWTTGTNRLKESRFIFQQLWGWTPEHVHHKDGNCTNDDPNNLEGMTDSEHHRQHMSFGMNKLTPAERLERSRKAVRALQEKRRKKNNHIITHIIPLEGMVPVYDITVEDTHNFIANEICVHNCEPRLLAHYSGCKVLVDGYNAKPAVDAHTAVAKAANIDRESGKRLNQALLTGAGTKKAASMLGRPMKEAMEIVDKYFESMPEIRELQALASGVMKSRGFVRSILNRRSRLEGRGYEYKAVNRLLQCSNADMIKVSMVKIDKLCRDEGGIDMLNNVHDALDFQYVPSQRKVYKEALRIMCDWPQLRVPIEVEEDSGPDWAWASYGEENWRKIMTEKGMIDVVRT